MIPKKFINNIIEGDALKLFKKIPDESIDMSFADPPFNLGKRYGSYNDRIEISEYLDWCKLWIDEMVRVTKPTGSIFIHNIPKWLTYFATMLNQNENAHFKHWISWNAMGVPLGKTLLPNHYGILWYIKSKEYKFYDIRNPHEMCRLCGGYLKDYGGKKSQMHSFGTIVSDVWTDIHRIRHNKRRNKHPCQLPLHLLERIILMCTDEKDIVLDPFIGTGTTAVASKKLGRQYVGFDIDPKYVDISKINLKNAKKTKMNGAYVSMFLNKVITLRDKDFEKIEHLLKIKTLMVTENNYKQQRIPYFIKVK